MNDNLETIKLTRDITATLVPFGNEVVLTKGTEIVITQALGGTFTAIANAQMVRIAGKDADALDKPQPISAIAGHENAPLEDKIWLQLKTCYDPEIPVNIVDLGLIYGVTITPSEDNKHNVVIRMTLTAPGCGMGPLLAEEAKNKVQELAEVNTVTTEIIFDPPWDRSMMSDQAKLQLGIL
jgi:probable FeS assembly SUF system protein SufT